MTIGYSVYLSACAILFCFGTHALYRMTRKCSHLRRAAFVLTASGAGVAFIEAIAGVPVALFPPPLSATLIVSGVALLHIIGSRELGRSCVLAKKH